ncbi:G protein-regulated inducer of neurite outgrowth 1 [Rhinichthys klamathensis goyatoka]|uniref:G protein-regulated inducer of neurite outgrowth 1 n=1 Tax=Rhinichthys klamathensis goyatoka TaxID=3034132 RepID=UPI0024B5FAD1|nr:G protein-regulated inducer of neurite outgrowth 1 [Rhinichthys klamathensis goyatoka]
MEGPVLTESEVWKVGSGTSSSLNTDDRSIDYSPLMNDTVTDENLSKASEIPGTSIQEQICGSIQEQPDPEVTSDQIKSVIPHEQRLEEDLPSTQTAVECNKAPPESACKQERCVDRAEEPADKICLALGRQNLDQEINQEITILVTNHDCIFEDEEDEEFGEQKTSSCPTEPETVSSVEGGGVTEEESLDGSIVVVNMIDVSQVQKTSVITNASTEQNTTNEEPRLPGDPGDSSNETNSGRKGSSTPQETDTSSTHANTRASVEVNVCSLEDQPTQPKGVEVKLEKIELTDSRNAVRPAQETLGVTRSPGRAQHVQTQVSLEVMYQSVATSPMTPPEGSAAFIFPSTFGKLANKCSTEVSQTKDAELQVGLQVEVRSVATAPMSPITLTAPEVIPEPEPRIGVVPEEAPEPVPEVSWDEKGMTWEVYGAVVEVAVLGTAIQKHLEKQVKKQNKQPSALPAPTDDLPADLTETSTPMPSSPPPMPDPGESSPAKEQREEKTVKSGRRRQNPFRQWFRNVRRPSCCSRPRQDEEN